MKQPIPKTGGSELRPTLHLYWRYSDDKQGSGDSERRQRQWTDEVLKEEGAVLSDLDFSDPGVSAFRGKNWLEGGLSRFRAAIQDGIVRPGDILLIEQLDRLSRMAPLKQCVLFNEILEAGVVIIQTVPRRRYTALACNDMATCMLAIIDMCTSHGYSLRLSTRIGDYWQQHRRTLQSGVAMPNGTLPFWIARKGEKIAS